MSSNKKPEFFNFDLEESNKPQSETNKLVKKQVEKTESQNTDEEKAIIDALNISKVTEFSVEILKPNFIQRILRKKYKVYEVKKVVLSQMTEITKRHLQLPEMDIETDEGLNKIIESVNENTINNVVEIVAIFFEGINFKKSTVKFLKDNLSTKETLNAVRNIINICVYQSFIATTLILKALSMKKKVLK